MLQRTTPLTRKTPIRRRALKKRAGRDKGYLAACRGEECYLKFPGICRGESARETVVPAHQNQDKGMGLKTADKFTVPACFWCHQAYDQSGIDRNVKRATWDWAYNQREGMRAQKMGIPHA